MNKSCAQSHICSTHKMCSHIYILLLLFKYLESFNPALVQNAHTCGLAQPKALSHIHMPLLPKQSARFAAYLHECLCLFLGANNICLHEHRQYLAMHLPIQAYATSEWHKEADVTTVAQNTKCTTCQIIKGKRPSSLLWTKTIVRLLWHNVWIWL